MTIEAKKESGESLDSFTLFLKRWIPNPIKKPMIEKLIQPKPKLKNGINWHAKWLIDLIIVKLFKVGGRELIMSKIAGIIVNIVVVL